MTPGHSGVDCKNQDWLKQQASYYGKKCDTPDGVEWRSIRYRPNVGTDGMFRLETGSEENPTDWLRIYFCPLCGIELKPDPEPLPVPEGYGRVSEVRDLHPDNAYTLQARGPNNERGPEVWASTKEEAYRIWRKAFSH